MPQLLERDVPQSKRRAVAYGRSAEAEHRIIFEETLRAGRAGFWQRAAALRAATHGRVSVESAELIREDRDHR